MDASAPIDAETRGEGALEITTLEDPRALAALSPAWDALVEDGPGAVFRSPAWLWRRRGWGFADRCV